VDLDEPARIGSGGQVQAIDVLRHQQVEVTGTLEVDEGPVPGIRFRSPRRVLNPALP
jgi:hypothetical protein